MKTIEVVAAIIYKDGAYFATQRGYGEFEVKAVNLLSNERYKRN